MNGFFTELGYFFATLWSNTWRWAIRKKRNLAISLGVVVVLIVVVGALTQGTAPRPEARPTPTPTPTSTEAYTEVTASPINGGAGTPTPAPTDAAQSATDEAEAAARQWATDYLARPSAEDTSWKERAAAYTIPTVLEQLDGQAFRSEGILEGQAPTEVTDIAIGAAPEGAETSTPVRWSRTLTATVQGQSGSTTIVTFGLVLMLGESGWTVTSVEEISVEG